MAVGRGRGRARASGPAASADATPRSSGAASGADGAGGSDGARRLSVLLLAEACNPDWPSLPVVAYKYARALGDLVDVTIATHPRNRPAIARAAPGDDRFVYLDNEWIAAPMARLADRLRGGAEVGWSTSMAMRYLPYLAFERAARRRFALAFRRGAFDLVHRISPMSPTLPSPLAGRTGTPFVAGPLNGGLDWPAAFRAEQRRERERLRGLRRLSRLLPHARWMQRRADLVLAAFPHTMADLTGVPPDRMVPFPEIGIDPAIFHARGRLAPFAGPGPARFVYAGRLVPYKLPEVAIRAMAGQGPLAGQRLSIIGDGPERPRLEALAADLGVADRVTFEGRRSQSEVACALRAADALVFPSIRELGAGIVIEAMACGALCIVADYGAPGQLAAEGRGDAVPLAPLEGMVAAVRDRMEACLADPAAAAARAEAGRRYAEALYPWARKAEHTVALYRDLLAGRPVRRPGPYA